MGTQANQRTLGDLRADLRTRLGFGAQGASGGAQMPILDSFLRSAQTILYWNYDWPELRITRDKTVGTQQEFIDYPDDIEPRRLISIRIQQGTYWNPPLIEGIQPWTDVNPGYFSVPCRFDVEEQLRLWPVTDQSYPIRFYGYKRLTRFSEEDDYSTIDGGLIFAKALADAKGHYRHPDAQTLQQDVAGLLRPLKAAAHGNRRYIPSPDCDWVPPPLPRIVGIDN